MERHIFQYINLILIIVIFLISGCSRKDNEPKTKYETQNYDSSINNSDVSFSLSAKNNLTLKKQFFALPYDAIVSITEEKGVNILYVDNIDWEKVDGAKEWTEICSVSAGYKNLFGLRTDGTVVATGNNESGQCNVSNWKDVITLDACYEHTVALKSDGTAYATGKNTDGRCLIENWKNLIDISAGYTHTVGLQNDGTVLVTGGNEWGQSELSDWRDMKMIVAGYYHTVGLQENGTVVAKGNNKFGQCNTEAWTQIKSIYAGKMHTVGLRNDGTVIATGNNDYGQCNVSEWKNVADIYVEKNYTVGKTFSGEILITGLCFYDKDISERIFYLNDYRDTITEYLLPETSFNEEKTSDLQISSKPELTSKFQEEIYSEQSLESTTSFQATESSQMIYDDKKTIPNIVGMSWNEASKVIKGVDESWYLPIKPIYEYSESFEKGQIIQQEPSAGEYADNNIMIDIIISLGKPKQGYDYEIMYKYYMNTCNKDGYLNDMDKLEYYIFDLDNDGIDECLFKFSGKSAFELSYIELCAIKNGQVKKILNASCSGGSYGGTNLFIGYDTRNHNPVVMLTSSSGGFGGTAGGRTIYDYTDGELFELVDFEYIENNDGSSQYTINNVSVTKESMEKAQEQYVQIKNNQILAIFEEPSNETIEEAIIRLQQNYS